MVQLSPRQWTVLGVGAAGAAVLTYLYGDPVTAVQLAAGYAVNVFDRGDRLSSSTVSSGVVQESIDELLAQASSTLGFDADADTNALARMGRSEGVDGEEYRMHVALNDLAQLQATYGGGVYSSLLALMIHSKVAAADGHFSEQALGKRYATTRDPYVGDYQLAQKVFADRANGLDPTGGATKFVDKSSFRAQPGATKTYDQVVAEWADQGLSPVSLPNASDNFVVFIRT